MEKYIYMIGFFFKLIWPQATGHKTLFCKKTQKREIAETSNSWKTQKSFASKSLQKTQKREMKTEEEEEEKGKIKGEKKSQNQSEFRSEGIKMSN